MLCFIIRWILITSATTTIYLLDANDIEVHSIDIFDDNGNHIRHGMSTVGNEVVRIRVQT